MKRLCVLVLAFFFGFLGSVKAAPPDVNGWQAYTWGMTGAQIQAAPGGAVRQERWWAPQRRPEQTGGTNGGTKTNLQA